MGRTTGVALISTLGAIGVHGQGYDNRNVANEVVKSPRMHEVLRMEDLPPVLDWRYKDGANYTTVSRNQHIPQYCGSCYVFGATSALSDRIRIARGGVGREINLAPQVVLNCDLVDHGCEGGHPQNVYNFIQTQGGIPDETCQPYEATGHDTGNACDAMTVCAKCDDFGCRPQESYSVYDVEEFGTVRGEFELMAELQRGPIACGIATPKSFVFHKGWDVYEDPEHDKNIDHIISVVGYGSEDGKDYWLVRNSWGTYWGHYGWARVARGKNVIAIEEDCAWAKPSNGGKAKMRHINGTTSKEAPTAWSWMTGIADVAQPKQVAQELDEAPAACRSPRNNWEAVGGEVLTSPRPHEEMKSEDLPKSWDWRNVSGRSFVTWNTNEKVPHGGCASCWAHGVTSALADRIAVQNHGEWPQMGLSPQMLINCNGGGGCSGGDPAGAYAYIARNGITDETCQNYQAKELPCDGADICRNCAPGGEQGLLWPGHCVAVRHPILWFVSEYGAVRGAGPMKAEIYKRGPIGCGLDATNGFRKYSGGIYRESRESWTLNQEVSLAGWGVAASGQGVPAGTEFWMGRNSWGTYWGEEGWFRINMHTHNLGVETDCDWGVPAKGPPVPSEFAEKVPALRNVQSVMVAGAFALSFVAGFITLQFRSARVQREEPAPYVLIE